MFARRQNSVLPQWPFWLLLAAWFCANCPSTAVHTALGWMVEARSFTHQQRLTMDVARVLTGEKISSPVAEAVARAQDETPAQRLPPCTVDTEVKKLEFSLEKTTEILPVARRANRYLVGSWVCPDPRRNPPPHGRPRETNAA